jgi:hypothetical protein
MFAFGNAVAKSHPWHAVRTLWASQIVEWTRRFVDDTIADATVLVFSMLTI